MGEIIRPNFGGGKSEAPKDPEENVPSLIPNTPEHIGGEEHYLDNDATYAFQKTSI